MNIREIRYKTVIWLSITVILFAMVACSSEDRVVADPEEGEALIVTAEVASQLHSRAQNYDELGNVTGGSYRLSYPLASANNSYTVAKVNFDKEDGDIPSGIGYVSTFNNNQLKWKDVGGSAPTFYLDNVIPVGDTDQATSTVINFTDDYNPYKAALFNEDENDLLWGEKQVQNGTTKNINFELHHNMARLRVQVTVDKTNGNLDLTNATVEISSINQVPLSYNRLDGSLTLPEVEDETDDKAYREVYTSLTLVDPEKGLDWKTKPTVEGTDEENGDADAGTAGEDKSEKDVYVSQDFVLPPQNLLENTYRPRLIITFNMDGEKRVYSGILPYAMSIYKENEADNTNTKYPVTLSFLKEHILTIRTVITEDPPELIFMPVWVVNWVYKGEFSLEAHQSGIYKAEEFYKLIDYYRAGNEYQLTRYGRLITEEGKEKWVFDFFHYVTLDYKEIYGKMKREEVEATTDFSFDFKGYTVTVVQYDEENGEYKRDENGELIIKKSESVTSEELYQLVRGEKSW